MNESCRSAITQRMYWDDFSILSLIVETSTNHHVHVREYGARVKWASKMCICRLGIRNNHHPICLSRPWYSIHYSNNNLLQKSCSSALSWDKTLVATATIIYSLIVLDRTDCKQNSINYCSFAGSVLIGKPQVWPSLLPVCRSLAREALQQTSSYWQREEWVEASTR